MSHDMVAGYQDGEAKGSQKASKAERRDYIYWHSPAR